DLLRGVPGLVGAALDPARRELAELAAELAVRMGGSLIVVRGSPKLELAVAVADRPGRPGVAVERHADAARVEQLYARWPGPPELLVTVAEDDLPVVHAGEQPLLVGLRLWCEALDVRERRAM